MQFIPSLDMALECLAVHSERMIGEWCDQNDASFNRFRAFHFRGMGVEIGSRVICQVQNLAFAR
jgi:hypothetical protein